MWRRRILLGLRRDTISSRRRDELRSLMRRGREVILLAALTGAVVGLAVRGFEYVVVELMYEKLRESPLWVQAIGPVVGLMVAALCLRIVGGGASPATSDEYLRAYHDPQYVLRPRHLAGRMMASIATLGSGGALGLEGPSLYGGSAIGSAIQRRLPEPFRGADHRTLLVAGAAAGVAAIFKAPATGAIFALEVPYRGDLGRRMLLPALVASASGYLVFVTLEDTTPLFRAGRTEDFRLVDLLGALAVGAACAIGARAFAKLMRMAKAAAIRPLAIRLAMSSVAIVLLFVAARALTGRSLSIGTGYEVIRVWMLDPDLAVWLLFCVLVIRCLATAFTTIGGGVGGVFVPLVVGGALVGRMIGELISPERYVLYSLLGIAAFLGAGYRVPLASVIFVAETTGRPNFVVPALFASVAAEMVMGASSITAYQRTPADVD